jgi:hypothetical protein
MAIGLVVDRLLPISDVAEPNGGWDVFPLHLHPGIIKSPAQRVPCSFSFPGVSCGGNTLSTTLVVCPSQPGLVAPLSTLHPLYIASSR